MSFNCGLSDAKISVYWIGIAQLSAMKNNGISPKKTYQLSFNGTTIYIASCARLLAKFNCVLQHL